MNSVEIILGGGQGMLKREVYYFYLENEYYLWLDYYAIQSRLTTRHKWVNEKVYNRLESRNSQLKEEDVILTETIKEKAIKQLLSQIKVQKWSEGK